MAKQFILPKLPYELDGLEPLLSKETLEYHYGKHHGAYITNLNGLINGGDLINRPIEDIISKADPGPLFNNAAQAYNHTFYWYGMRPPVGESEANLPTGDISVALNEAFGTFDEFKSQFTDIAVKHFGSGWAWLLKNKSGKLEAKGMHDASTPLQEGDIPLLALDVWEHAYYIDYRNARVGYISAFWQLINWDFVQKQLLKPDTEPLMVATEAS